MTNKFQGLFTQIEMNNMGRMFEYAINDLAIDRNDFVRMFLDSSICRRLEHGDPKFTVGMCGEELALRIIEDFTGVMPEADVSEAYERRPDYWCGR